MSSSRPLCPAQSPIAVHRQLSCVREQVNGSGWTQELALDSADTAKDKVETRPVLIKAVAPGQGVQHEVVARLDLVGGRFARTMVLPACCPAVHAGAVCPI